MADRDDAKSWRHRSRYATGSAGDCDDADNECLPSRCAQASGMACGPVSTSGPCAHKRLSGTPPSCRAPVSSCLRRPTRHCEWRDPTQTESTSAEKACGLFMRRRYYAGKHSRNTWGCRAIYVMNTRCARHAEVWVKPQVVSKTAMRYGARQLSGT